MEAANDKLDDFSQLPSAQAGEAYGPILCDDWPLGIDTDVPSTGNGITMDDGSNCTIGTSLRKVFIVIVMLVNFVIVAVSAGYLYCAYFSVPSSEVYGPPTLLHARAMQCTTTAYAIPPSTTLDGWSLGTATGTPTSTGECVQDNLVNDDNENISTSLRNMTIAILVLISFAILLAMARVLYRAYQNQKKDSEDATLAPLPAPYGPYKLSPNRLVRVTPNRNHSRPFTVDADSSGLSFELTPIPPCPPYI